MKNLVCLPFDTTIYSDAVNSECCGVFGGGSGPILLDDLDCQSDAESLDGCSGWEWGSHNCDHSEDASVLCRTENTPEEGTCELTN